MNQKVINVSEANLYAQPTYRSEITTQALLGEVVDVLQVEEKFTLIKLNDTYQDWIDNEQLCDYHNHPVESQTVRSHIARILQQPDNNSFPMRDATIGCRFPIIEERENWFQVVLPDGLKGWISKEHFSGFPEYSRNHIVKLAHEFLGYPYFWGGKTPKGLDCSGFVQLVFSLLGKQISRDAWMQHRDAKQVSENYLDAQPGDLYFFGNETKKIDHVGIALGEGKIIHASGMVKINSMNKEAPDFSERLIRKFVAVKTFF